MGGNTGLGGSGLGESLAILPLDQIALMVLPTLRKADRVRMLRKPHEGETGTITELRPRGRLDITLASGTKLEDVIIEHVEKLTDA